MIFAILCVSYTTSLQGVFDYLGYLTEEDIERMVQHYEERDLLALTRLTLRYVTDEKKAFLDKLLWQRNEKMVQRLKPLFDEGKVFVAVGAMHLPGEKGILRRLEQQGFVVEAIY